LVVEVLVVGILLLVRQVVLEVGLLAMGLCRVVQEHLDKVLLVEEIPKQAMAVLEIHAVAGLVVLQ
jgi:hypothetical protein